MQISKEKWNTIFINTITWSFIVWLLLIMFFVNKYPPTILIFILIPLLCHLYLIKNTHIVNNIDNLLTPIYFRENSDEGKINTIMWPFTCGSLFLGFIIIGFKALNIITEF
jgi:hypothetical protein